MMWVERKGKCIQCEGERLLIIIFENCTFWQIALSFYMLVSTDIEISAAERRQFRDVLNESFDPHLIKRALEMWGERKLYQYVSPNADMQEIVFELIREAGASGWIGELIVYTYCQMPDNKVVYTFFETIRARIFAVQPHLAALVEEAENKLRRSSPADRLAQRKRERAETTTQTPQLSTHNPLDYDQFVIWHNLASQVKTFRQCRKMSGCCGFSVAEPYDDLQLYIKDRLRMEMEWPDPSVRDYRRHVEAGMIHLYSSMFEDGDGASVKQRIEHAMGRKLNTFFDTGDDALLVLINQNIPKDEAALLAKRLFESVSSELERHEGTRKGAFILVWVECSSEALHCDVLHPIPSPFELRRDEIADWLSERLAFKSWPQKNIDEIQGVLEKKMAQDATRLGLFQALKNTFQHAQSLQAQLIQ